MTQKLRIYMDFMTTDAIKIAAHEASIADGILKIPSDYSNNSYQLSLQQQNNNNNCSSSLSSLSSLSSPSSLSSSSSNNNNNNNINNKQKVRRGKWTQEEEAYVNRLIEEFKAGTLAIPNGITLRTFLSKLLNCDPMRISKKFVGNNCIGKQVYRRTVYIVDEEQAKIAQIHREELAELEKSFKRRLNQTNYGDIQPTRNWVDVNSSSQQYTIPQLPSITTPNNDSWGSAFQNLTPEYSHSHQEEFHSYHQQQQQQHNNNNNNNNLDTQISNNNSSLDYHQGFQTYDNMNDNYNMNNNNNNNNNGNNNNYPIYSQNYQTQYYSPTNSNEKSYYSDHYSIDQNDLNSYNSNGQNLQGDLSVTSDDVDDIEILGSIADVQLPSQENNDLSLGNQNEDLEWYEVLNDIKPKDQKNDSPTDNNLIDLPFSIIPVPNDINNISNQNNNNNNNFKNSNNSVNGNNNLMNTNAILLNQKNYHSQPNSNISQLKHQLQLQQLQQQQQRKSSIDTSATTSSLVTSILSSSHHNILKLYDNCEDPYNQIPKNTSSNINNNLNSHYNINNIQNNQLINNTSNINSNQIKLNAVKTFLSSNIDLNNKKRKLLVLDDESNDEKQTTDDPEDDPLEAYVTTIVNRKPFGV